MREGRLPESWISLPVKAWPSQHRKKMIGGSISRRPCSGASLAYVLMICLLVFTEVKFHTIDLAEGNVPFRT